MIKSQSKREQQHKSHSSHNEVAQVGNRVKRRITKRAFANGRVTSLIGRRIHNNNEAWCSRRQEEKERRTKRIQLGFHSIQSRASPSTRRREPDQTATRHDQQHFRQHSFKDSAQRADGLRRQQDRGEGGLSPTHLPAT